MGKKTFLLGFDIGTSSIKATLLDARTGKVTASASSPKAEIGIVSKQAGWAEQDPELWWTHVVEATREIAATPGADLNAVEAIGITYQMHGLVLVDKAQKPVCPSLIWCDSRAVAIGKEAFEAIGRERCLAALLNSPGNFTASKLKWVKEHAPRAYARADKAMLPGDFIAMKMTGEIATTTGGLSEATLWDFSQKRLAGFLLDHYGIAPALIPPTVPTFGIQGRLRQAAAELLGLRSGIPLAYRAGDQPNNAFSLHVLEPGEVAATAGTSGVVYGVGDAPICDPKSRINTFAHVNYSTEQPRYGALMCVNGCAILNNWAKNNLFALDTADAYASMDRLAAASPVGARGLVTLPYGNGAERCLENRSIGASLHGIDFNRHNRSDLLRSMQEGIAFALNYGVEQMQALGMPIELIRAGKANMFLSPTFRTALASATQARIELYATDGAAGAARGAGVGAGVYADFDEAFAKLELVTTTLPEAAEAEAWRDAYANWRECLEQRLLEHTALQ